MSTPFAEETAVAQGHRTRRIEKILLEETRALLRDEARDPALGAVELLSIELSPDGGTARFPYVVNSSLASEEVARRESKQALERATAFLRARLAGQLEMKRTPKLAFSFVGVRERETDPEVGR